MNRLHSSGFSSAALLLKVTLIWRTPSRTGSASTFATAITGMSPYSTTYDLRVVAVLDAFGRPCAMTSPHLSPGGNGEAGRIFTTESAEASGGGRAARVPPSLPGGIPLRSPQRPNGGGY